jgi:hypothetical protein
MVHMKHLENMLYISGISLHLKANCTTVWYTVSELLRYTVSEILRYTVSEIQYYGIRYWEFSTHNTYWNIRIK